MASLQSVMRVLLLCAVTAPAAAFVPAATPARVALPARAQLGARSACVSRGASRQQQGECRLMMHGDASLSPQQGDRRFPLVRRTLNLVARAKSLLTALLCGALLALARPGGALAARVASPKLPEVAAVQTIDAKKLNLEAFKATKQYQKVTNPKFYFTDQFTSLTEVQEEVQSLVDERQDRKASEVVEGVGITLVVVVMCRYMYMGLRGVEKWMKSQEEKDKAEEIEMTGQYISFEAGDVKGAVDPKTGEEIKIKAAKKKDDNAGGGGAPPPPPPAPDKPKSPSTELKAQAADAYDSLQNLDVDKE